MGILFSCTFAPAAESYKMHLTTEEQNTSISAITKAAFILHKEYYMSLFD
jgi:hypothetical protein